VVFAVDVALLLGGVEAAASQSAAQSASSEEQTILPQLLIVSPALVIDTDSEFEIADSQEDSDTNVEGTAFPDADSSDVAFDAFLLPILRKVSQTVSSASQMIEVRFQSVGGPASEVRSIVNNELAEPTDRPASFEEYLKIRRPVLFPASAS